MTKPRDFFKYHFFRYGDLYPELSVQSRIINEDVSNERAEMINVRKYILDRTADLRYRSCGKLYYISDDFNRPVSTLTLKGNTEFKKYLFNNDLSFYSERACQEVIDEMLKAFEEYESSSNR